MQLSERMRSLFERSRAYAKSSQTNSFEHDIHAAAVGLYKDLPQAEKIARSMAYAIVNQNIYIDEGDRIIGRVYYDNPVPVEKHDPDIYVHGENDKYAFQTDEHYKEMRSYQLVTCGTPGHVAWSFVDILKLGTSGIRERCREGMIRRADDEIAKEFYTGAIIMLDAVDEWNERHVGELVRRGMNEEAEICRRVPKYPARTFREAVQAFFMQHILVMKECPYGGNSPGRLDYYLWPYLEADMKSGILTLDDAEELIEELFIRIDERIYKRDGWGESVIVGGTDENGASAVNPLSYAMIRAFMKYDLTHPYFYVRIPKDAPADFVKLAAKYVRDGKNRAQILNDEAITRALVKNGVSTTDANDYFCGGCMEVGIQGKTSDFLFNGYHNIPKILELCITGGLSLNDGRTVGFINGGGLGAFSAFEDFYAYFIDEARKIFEKSFRCMDVLSERAEARRPSLLLSTMIEDCIERGRNMHGGGARYHDYGAAVIGLPNTADSLYAIKRAVFTDKICTAEELIAALKANFVGHEMLRARLQKLPKYGQENAEADEMAKRLVCDVANIFSGYKNRHGGNAKLVILSFIWAPTVGAILGATPDGRLAGTPVAQAMTPQSSAMTKGITAAMNSCTSLPFELFAGGASTMWDLDPEWASEEVIEHLVMGFFKNGGQIFQGNATSIDELIDAQKNPERYENLIVRVGGFSARFTRLDKALQNEIINRVRHRS